MKTLLALLLITTNAFSQIVAPIKKATANDLVEKLAPAIDDQPKSRSLGSRNIIPQPKSIDLVIQFDLDSAKLKEPSKPLLDSLVEAMKNERLASIKFKIEGHTDAQGSEQHNLKLSQSRADSVMAYLTSQGVDKERLAGEGKGFSELLLPEKPKAAENRRVKITTQP
jgi:outer membrane protein OmpA-like peptidoglycan-associated protein